MPSRDLVLRILGDALGAEKALKEAQKDLKETGDHAEKTGKHFGGMAKFAAIAGGAAGVGLLVEGLKGSIEAASAEQAAQAGLDSALKATHQSVTAMKPALEEAAASSRKLGFSDIDTEHALMKLEIATGNTKTSIADLSVAQDIARVKHMSLEAASQTLAQAMTGSQRAAKQLGISVSPVTDAVDKLKASNEDLTTSLGKADLAHAKLMDKMATGKDVIAAVTDKVHGQADAYANTAAGGMAQFKVQMEHLQATIGEKLIPVVTMLLTAINNAVVYIEAHWPQISAVFDQVMRVVQNVWTSVGQPIFDAILIFSRRAIDFVRDHWPEISATVREVFTTVHNIINAAVTVIEALWRQFGGMIKTVISNNLDAVEGIFRGMFTSIKGVFNLIDDLIHGRWSQLWGDAKQIVSGAINAALAALTGAIDNMLAVGKGLGSAFLNGITSGLSALGGVLENLIKAPINAVIRAWNALGIPSFGIHLKLPGPLPDINFSTPSLSLPDMPTLETGGMVLRTGLAVVHEGETFSGVGRGLGGPTIHLTVNGVIGSDMRKIAGELVDHIHAELLQVQHSRGSLGFNAA